MLFINFNKIFQAYLFFSLIVVYISFNLNSYDSQPWYILAGIIVFTVYFISRKFKIEPVFIWGLILPVFSFIIGLVWIDVNNFNFYRSVAGYLGFYFVFVTAYHLLMSGRVSQVFNLLVLANIVWLSFSIYQLAFGVYSIDFMLHIRSHETRGVTSIAPEPSQFGMVLLFLQLSMLAIAARCEEKKHVALFVFILNFLFILFVAKSSMALAYEILLIILLISRLRLIFALMILLSGVLVFFLMGSFLSESDRIVKVVTHVYDDPMFVLSHDASINWRVANLYYSVLGFLENVIPQGYSNFEGYVANAKAGSSLFWYGTPKNEIMSGLGGLFFELGLIGFLFWLYFSILFYRNLSMYLFLLYLISVFASFASVTFSFPFMAVVFGIFLYLANQKNGYIVIPPKNI